MAEQDMRELGSTGLKRSGGVILEEYLPELTGSRWFNVVREMQDHPIVSAMLYLVGMQMRRVQWAVKPADASKTAKKWADMMDTCMQDMSSTWADTISEIDSMFPYGFAVLELVYKKRDGKVSRYNDGLIGWRKWAPRPQDTISWEFDEAGGVEAIEQNDYYAVNAKSVRIPIEKLLLFRTISRKSNPEGRSLLRSAYRPYYFAKHLANVQAIWYERLNGIPYGRVPSQILSASATVAQQAILTDFKEIVTNLRVDEQAGIILPSDRDENGNPYYELSLLRADSQGGYDIEATIERNHMEILMSILADPIMMGHTSVGSNALSVTKMDMFWTGIDAMMQGIADVINRHAISKLMKLNGVPEKYWPKLVPGSVERVDLDQLGQYIVRLSGSGVPISDPELQRYLLRQGNMPVSAEMEAGKMPQPVTPTAAAGKMEDAGRSAQAATKQRNENAGNNVR